MSENEQATTVAFSDEQQLRLRQALGAMPYGGLTSMRSVRDFDELLRWLDELRGVLQGVASRATENDRQLTELQYQQRAMRSFLGLDELRAEITTFVRDELADVAAELKGDDA